MILIYYLLKLEIPRILLTLFSCSDLDLKRDGRPRYFLLSNVSTIDIDVFSQRNYRVKCDNKGNGQKRKKSSCNAIQ